MTDTFLISAGYLYTDVGVSDEYQSDFTHELDSHTIGLGGRVMLSPKIALDFGGLYVTYTEAQRPITTPEFPLPFTETYQRSSWAFSIGIGFIL